MDSIYYIGLDVHKKTIAYCIKRSDGKLIRQGTVKAERKALLEWLSGLPGSSQGTGFISERVVSYLCHAQPAEALEKWKSLTELKRLTSRAEFPCSRGCY